MSPDAAYRRPSRALTLASSQRNALPLSAAREHIIRSIMSMYAEPFPRKASAPERVEGYVVFAHLDPFNHAASFVDDLKERYPDGGLGDVVVKRNRGRSGSRGWRTTVITRTLDDEAATRALSVVAVLMRYSVGDVGHQDLDRVTHLGATADGAREGTAESLNHEILTVTPDLHIAA